MFNIQEMKNFAYDAIQKFAAQHQDETFYAFAIDAELLCLNSEEQFRKTLASYKQRSPKRYQTEKQVEHLKGNTGDWQYQGFAKLSKESGFDDVLYNEHFRMNEGEQKQSEYGKAIDEVIKLLVEHKAFDNLNRTDDFWVGRVEHE